MREIRAYKIKNKIKLFLLPVRSHIMKLNGYTYQKAAQYHAYLPVMDGIVYDSMAKFNVYLYSQPEQLQRTHFDDSIEHWDLKIDALTLLKLYWEICLSFCRFQQFA